MAMYYYARRLQKSVSENTTNSSKKKKNGGSCNKAPQAIATQEKVSLREPLQVPLPSSSLTATANGNGSVPSATLEQDGGGQRLIVSPPTNNTFCDSSSKSVQVRSTNKSENVKVGESSVITSYHCSSANNANNGACGGEGYTGESGSQELDVITRHRIAGTLIFSASEGSPSQKHLVSGTLEGLIDYLVPNENHYPEKAFLFAFLLCSRIFIRPHALLRRVVERVFSPSFSCCGDKAHPSKETTITSVTRLLREWTQLFPYDFRDEEGLMMANVRALTTKCVSVCPQVKDEVSLLLSSLLERLTELEKFEDKLEKINLEVREHQQQLQQMRTEGRMRRTTAVAVVRQVLNPATTNPATIQLHNYSPESIAEQLTLLDQERFSFIGGEEFIQAFIKKDEPSWSSPTSTAVTASGIRGSPSSKKVSRLHNYVEWFHGLSAAVAVDIVGPQSRKDRTQRVSNWTKVAQTCVSFGNYNSAMAIFTGINSRAVRRLRKTWSKFREEALLSVLASAFDPSNNFANYREMIKASSCSSSRSGSTLTIPFFSLLVKDLFFLNQEVSTVMTLGSPTNSQQHIPFTAFLQMGALVGEVMAWQKQQMHFLKTRNHLKELSKTLEITISKTFQDENESLLLLTSYQREAPFTQEESLEFTALRNGGGSASRNIPPFPPASEEEEEDQLTDSFQSLPLPSTSSESGVHEDESSSPNSNSTVATAVVGVGIGMSPVVAEQQGNVLLGNFLYLPGGNNKRGQRVKGDNCGEYT